MKTILPIEIFPIEDDGYHLKTTLLVNSKSANVIIDTGASRSVFDETRITNYINFDELEDHDRLSSGLGTNTMVSKKVTLDKLQIGDICINNYEATILDLSHVNTSYEKLDIAPIDGILGGDILHYYNAVIDYDNRELVLIN
ncbi:MAG: retropepsin-like aspartic protease [Vicingaceae bacterium]|nr:retropepsin-like aspartic protease [Vicingaceae bacterium]